MTPQQFIAKWKRVQLSERSAAQQHFRDLCELLSAPKPAEADPDGTQYTFERGVSKSGGGDGWADVWMRGHFGWEYEGKHKDLAAAYQQLLEYREDLENPPLLVVCDMDRFEVHTNFTATANRRYVHDPDSRGIGTVRYPRRVPKDDECAGQLAKLTLTNLYNKRPTWLAQAHERLDAAVFAAYGWKPSVSDDQILAQLLELNLQRSSAE